MINKIIFLTTFFDQTVHSFVIIKVRLFSIKRVKNNAYLK